MPISINAKGEVPEFFARGWRTTLNSEPKKELEEFTASYYLVV
jgi:hypothetical protein